MITPPPIVNYLASLRRLPHPQLDVIASESSGIPIVDPQTGALLHALVRTKPSARVLEIGTAVGYSGLWMATALPRMSAPPAKKRHPTASPSRITPARLVSTTSLVR